jgi:hypothetical protein
MRLNKLHTALLVSFLVGCASEEASQEGGRFDEIVSPAPDADKKAEPPADAPPATPGALSPEPTEETPAASENAPASACRTARDLGAISGDTGTPSVSAQGTCSEWLRVRVTENWSGPTAGPMKLTATLISPDKEDFDVAVYVNAATDVLECSTLTEKSELPTGSDIVKSQWGEQYTFNNGDDARTVSIEVKKKTGGCAKQPWALLLQGNY